MFRCCWGLGVILRTEGRRGFGGEWLVWLGYGRLGGDAAGCEQPGGCSTSRSHGSA